MNMLDTTPIAAAIKSLIAAGISERELLAAVARKFPELITAELSAAAQDAMAAAERNITKSGH